jgi:nitroimidazol reductase NimA-like FMN-containing flavoprotein (pyridoxamine 5'-phosphate oxidase superfamily)
MIKDAMPYIVPVGFGFWEGKIFFHTCSDGFKMAILSQNPIVCFEVDESLSDASLAKSVVILGRVEVIDDPARMIPYLQRLIEKYRVSVSFGEYMKQRDVRDELRRVRICVITPHQVTGRRLIRKNGNF